MFKTYMASAGAGKTTSLVAEYLSICLKDEKSLSQYRHILAVTFTNNATAEMKDRIVQTLNKFAFEKKETWGIQENAIFDKILDANPELKKDENVVIERSRQLLADILYDYANFSISTIDSFFQRIVRAFAYELGISMSYEVEVTLDECFSQCVDMLLNRLSAANPDLKERILNLVNAQMEDKGKWRIEKALTGILGTIYSDENAASPLAELNATENCNAILAALQKDLDASRQNMLDLKKKAHDFFPVLGLTAEDLAGKTKGVWGCFDNFDIFTEKNYADVWKVLNGDGKFVKKSDPKYANTDQDIADFFNLLLKEQRAFLRKNSLFGNVKNMMLIFDLKGIMDEIRERDNKFFLSDTNFKINSEVKASDTPFIYEKIGNQYRHFFIDEFQDTSHMQWDNLVPLLQNALSFPTGQVILFGDVKQAIYRFRNGDSKLLSELSQPTATQEYNRLFPGDKNCSRRKLELLDTNYRSYGNIVEFNNLFFELLPQLEGFMGQEKDGTPTPLSKLYPSYYKDVKQKINPDFEKKGAVCLHFMGPTEEKEDYLKKNVVASVKDALSRNFQQKDIAVLTSSNSDGSMLGRELTKAGYNVISSDSLMLSSSPEVNLLIAVIRYLVNYNDVLSRFIIANYVLRKRGKNIAEELGANLENVSDGEKFRHLLEVNELKIKYFQWERLPLFTLISEILKAFGITESNAFVVALMDNALEYLKNKNGELTAFLDWWDTKGSSLAIKAPEGVNAITISTIHRSKGLQYPVVIIPFTQYKNYDVTQETYWYQPVAADHADVPYLMIPMKKEVMGGLGKETEFAEERSMSQLDNLNKIYVAQTRAKKLMYILTGRREKTQFSNYNTMLDSFVSRGEKESWPLRFIQGKNDPLCYWWGDTTVGEKETAVQVNVGTPEELPCSGFDMRQLSTHINKVETPEQAIGNAVHDYLSKLTHFPQSAAEVDQLTFSSEQLYVDEIKSALKFIATSKEWRPYFADGLRVLNEVPILPTKAILDEDNKEKASRPSTTYRPDRIVLLENKTVVIDYKTGHPTEDVKEKYNRQVEKYVDLLKAMGLSNVEGRILYIEG